ncbi:hypothetical protein LTR78_006192 [Recurvomyces mirabilis]|uniref:Major facilitator superfamily (MFS) profile domain-containing protein n=1 Tax=Recurvomyces mirabilis TaxID=574656 RepID=A0AAE1C0L3_9PEZI|nr:hypothetical protein LTR78_006192 [Recurvomyces mirabilis]KAK5152033.1 hypothetical protein LTS14_008807 [Recurvomyces mirabilis]
MADQSESEISIDQTLESPSHEEKLVIDRCKDLEIHDLGVNISSKGLVSWRDDSPDHPRNWTHARKSYDIVVVAMLEFFTEHHRRELKISHKMKNWIARLTHPRQPSAADQARTESGMSHLKALVAFSLMYQLGQALGGLIVPPCSETFGRRMPYIISGATFALCCLLIGIVPSMAMVYVGRFVSGFASAVPSVVLAGSVEDLFNARSRVWLVLLWNSLATAGLVVGPVFGVYVSLGLGWYVVILRILHKIRLTMLRRRWIYYISAIVTAALTVATLFIRESRPSLILASKVAALRKQFDSDLSFDNHDAVADHSELLNIILIRPASLLVTEPLVILVTTLSAISWAIIYLFTEALTGIYRTIGFSRTSASLPFLAIGLGVLLSIFPRFQDMKVARRRKLRGEPLEPEDKLSGFILAVVALAIGLWWFAWTIPPLVTSIPWIVPTIGLVFVGFAVNEMAYTLSSYLADSYTVYAASAFAALAFVRAIISGLMPLIAYAMYENMSANLATTIIASVATLFGVAPYILLKYSKNLRRISRFTKYSLEVHERTRIEAD